jgi:hypothetical protein
VQQNLGSAFQVINDNLGVRPVYLIRVGGDIAQFEARYTLTPLLNIPTGEPVFRVDAARSSTP